MIRHTDAPIALDDELLLPETVAIPGGRFRMGSEEGRPDECPVREIEVDAFRMATTPVTVAQYARFVGARGFEAPPFWRDPDFSHPDQPVVGVTWFDAAAYAAFLEATTGDPWRLPTEAEWERAARGGLVDAPTAWGASLPLNEVPDGPLRGPWPVGQGSANPYGLFDMGTIVHEWCEDVYLPYGAPVPQEASDRPERRASRGGSWRHRQRWSSPAARSSLPPGFRYADYGFRPVIRLSEGRRGAGPR